MTPGRCWNISRISLAMLLGVHLPRHPLPTAHQRWMWPGCGASCLTLASPNRSRWPTDSVWTVVQAAPFADAPVEARRLIGREVRSDRVEQRDRGSYGLLVSRTALAFADPKHWNLEYAMAQLYKAFEVESQNPGKVFDELVRRRRRELGLAVPSEDRVLPYRSQASESLPALDIAIDHELDIPTVGHTLSLLRTERRLEELDVAIQDAQQQGAPLPFRTRHRLEQAFEQEMQTNQALTVLHIREES